MKYQNVFKRYEFKYLITKEQKEKVINEIKPYLELDKYGETVIRNIYFDTLNYRLIRLSIEKPIYKEKLRVRSYQKVSKDDQVFVELKKKYDGVVFKRRVAMQENEAFNWLTLGKDCGIKSQIVNEIDYFISYYQNLFPTMFVSYEREAYYSKDISDFRLTFDKNIICRDYDLTLNSDVYGECILDSNYVLMEIKCTNSIPLWLARFLSNEKIYKTSFSKYGTAYEKMILSKINKEVYVEE